MSITAIGTQLAASIKPSIEQITKANGFLTDIGNKVFHVNADEILDNPDDLPAVLIRSSSDQVVEQQPGVARRTRTVLIEIYFPISVNYEEQMDQAAVDIYRAIVPTTFDGKLAALAESIEVGAFEYDHPQPGERVAVLSTEITFTYMQRYR